MATFRLALCLLLPLGLPWLLAAAQEKPKMTAHEVIASVSAAPTGATAKALATRLRETFGEEALRKGVVQKDGLTFVWLLAVEGEVAPTVVELGNWTGKHHADRKPLLESARQEQHQMAQIGASDLYAVVVTLPNHLCFQYEYRVGTRAIEGDWVQTDEYPVHPDSQPQPGVPKGTVTKYAWKSTVLAGTERDYWVYVPAQYRAEGPPACVMVFQDGGMYVEAGVPTMLDNLIHKGEVPVTVGVFVSAGWIPGDAGKDRNIRIEEYHDQSDRYARFLTDELLPEVEKTVKLRHDAAGRAICGISSGAVCAFTAAWQRPNLFSKVVCHVGSFVNIRGTYAYPFLIRENPPKPIRIWLQDGANDLDDECGSWVLGNKQMAEALRFRGYDYHYDFGEGFHNLNHGAATLPDTLRWLWREGTEPLMNADGHG